LLLISYWKRFHAGGHVPCFCQRVADGLTLVLQIGVRRSNENLQNPIQLNFSSSPDLPLAAGTWIRQSSVMWLG
jgi:hypothetical protein